MSSFDAGVAELVEAIADNAATVEMIITRQPESAAYWLDLYREQNAVLVAKLPDRDHPAVTAVRTALAEAMSKVQAAADFAATMGAGNLEWQGLGLDDQ